MVQKPSLRATLLQMKPGETETIPFGFFASATVRNCASNLAGDLGRSFTVHVDRIGSRFLITRNR